MFNSKYRITIGADLDTKDIMKNLDKLSKTTKIKIDVDGDTVTREVSKWKDAFGGTVTQVKNLNKETGEWEKSLTRISEGQNKHGQGLLEITGKIGKFMVAASALSTATTGITSAVQAVLDLDKAVTEFTKVSEYSGSQLDKYIDKMYEVADATAKTGTEAMNAATEFVKMGYSEQESVQLAQDALTWTNIADGMISASEAAQMITANLKAFDKQGVTSTQVIDALNEVNITSLPLW